MANLFVWRNNLGGFEDGVDFRAELGETTGILEELEHDVVHGYGGGI